MAEWKKVIVSGSDISQLNNDANYLINGQSGATLTGSFSGSFVGTTDLPDLTAGEGISTFTYDGSGTATVAVSGAAQLSDNTVTKWNNTDGKFVNSNITDNGSVVNINSATNITGSLYVSGSTVTLNSTTFYVEIDSIPFIQAGAGSGVEIADASGNPSIDSENRILYDSASVDSLNWNNRQLIKSDGTTVTVDWENGLFSGSFSGSFQGNGSGLTNIPASGITGLNLSMIATGSVTSSVNVGTNAFTVASESIQLFNVRANGGVEHGVTVTAYGDYSHAEGYNTLASGSYSHSEGYNTLAKGSLSHAEGDGTKAHGQGSHTEGQNTIASGSYSHAEGFTTLAKGSHSHAEGQATLASGSYSHAEGFQTIASGSYSHAEGENTQAIGDSSHAEGDTSQAIGEYSHAEGESTVAYGPVSHTEGVGTKTGGNNGYLAISVVAGLVTLSGSYGDVSTDYPAGNYLYLNDFNYDNTYTTAGFLIESTSFNGTETEILLVDTSVDTGTAIVGNLNLDPVSWTGDQVYGGPTSHAEGSYAIALGFASHAEGDSTIAAGGNSHAEGSGTIASGAGSHAEGANTIASGDYSHAEGNSTTASGNYSHAEGDQTTASGSYSHAEGANTIASGDYSHAEGDNTTASGVGSHAEGRGTIASGSYQLAAGQYNTHNNTNSLVVIGNGVNNANRSDLALFNSQSITFNQPVTGSIFSGSFIGTFSGSNDLADLTAGAGVVPFTYDGTNTATVAISGAAALSDNTVVKWDTGDGKFLNTTITDDGTLVTFSGDALFQGDITVQGTASFQNTENLLVADRFVLFGSGSNAAGDGGIVVQQGVQNVGELFGYENTANRWGFTSSFDASSTSYTPAAFVAAVIDIGAGQSDIAQYQKNGNIKIDTGDIWIYA
jgi:hypothetical protein